MSVDKFYITYRTDSLYNVNMDCAMFLFTYQLLNRTHTCNYHILNKRGKTRIMFGLYCLILHAHFFDITVIRVLLCRLQCKINRLDV